MTNVCIIGAGSSGIAGVKALKDAGIDFDCFEGRDRVGGLWAYDPDPESLSGAYRGLNSNAPKSVMQYKEYPMADDLPGFPSHWDFARYFQNYTQRFGLVDHITFNTRVESVRPLPDGGFEVQLDDGTARNYTDVVVANGHHWSPKWPVPAFPGEFEGMQMHSHAYRESTFAAGKRVAVVGMGNSAMDISVEVSDVADATFLVARSGVHIMPKYVFGSTPPKWAIDLLSYKVGRIVFGAFARAYVGSPRKLGLPEPTHAFGDTHPTMSGRIADRLLHGRVTPKPNIAEYEGSKVRFIDGSVEQVDIVIYCTGYRIQFPFFDEGYISAPENEIHPFQQVALPDRPGIWFLGLCQPLGSIQPIAEQQGKWIADLITGAAALPPEGEMRAAIAAHRKATAKRFVKSTRNTIEVDHAAYLRDLAREHSAGRARARTRVKSPAELERTVA